MSPPGSWTHRAAGLNPGSTGLSLSDSFTPPAAQRTAGWRDRPPLGRRTCAGQKPSSHLTLLRFSPSYFLGYNQSTVRNPRVSSFYFYVLIYFFFGCQVSDCLRDSHDKYLSPSQKKLRFPLLSPHSVALPVLLARTADQLQWVQSPAVG